MTWRTTLHVKAAANEIARWFIATPTSLLSPQQQRVIRSDAFAYGAYFVFLICIFLTNTLFLAHYVYIFGVLPTVFLGVLLAPGRTEPLPASIAASIRRLANSFAPHGSFLLRASAIYVLALWLATAVEGNPGWLHRSPIIWRAELLALSVEVLTFVAVTAFLMSARPNFATVFFTVSTAIVAISAFINMVQFAAHVPFSGHLYDYRLVPRLGMPEYFGSTTVNFTYSVFLMGAIGTILDFATVLRANDVAVGCERYSHSCGNMDPVAQHHHCTRNLLCNDCSHEIPPCKVRGTGLFGRRHRAVVRVSPNAGSLFASRHLPPSRNMASLPRESNATSDSRLWAIR